MQLCDRFGLCPKTPTHPQTFGAFCGLTGAGLSIFAKTKPEGGR